MGVSRSAALEARQKSGIDGRVYTAEQATGTEATRNTGQDTLLVNHDTRLNGQDAQIGNQTTVNTNQSTTLAAHVARIAALEARMNNAETVNSNQTTRLDNYFTDITALNAFKNRTIGFAALSHLHLWGDLPNNGRHGNDLHSAVYVTAAHAHAHDHDAIYYRKSYVSDNFATKPHGAASHI